MIEDDVGDETSGGESKCGVDRGEGRSDIGELRGLSTAQGGGPRGGAFAVEGADVNGGTDGVDHGVRGART